MILELTQFELDVLEATLKQHTDSIGLLDLNPAKLKVVRREPTGVGAYIVLDRRGQPLPRAGIDHQLGFTGDLEVPGVPSGLGAVVDIESGQMNHIEFFTYGDESWNGNTSHGIVK